MNTKEIAATSQIRAWFPAVPQRRLATLIDGNNPVAFPGYELFRVGQQLSLRRAVKDASGTASWATIYGRIRRIDKQARRVAVTFVPGDLVRIARKAPDYVSGSFENIWVPSMDNAVGGEQTYRVRKVTAQGVDLHRVSGRAAVGGPPSFKWPPASLEKVAVDSEQTQEQDEPSLVGA